MTFQSGLSKRVCLLIILFNQEQQKVIETLKFQQSQVAFKEQIALLEQIKAKQVT